MQVIKSLKQEMFLLRTGQQIKENGRVSWKGLVTEVLSSHFALLGIVRLHILADK